MVKKMIKIIAFLFFMLSIKSVFSQTVNAVQLEQCYEWALEQLPSGRRPALLEEQTRLKKEQIDLSRLPQLQLNASASYQSDVVQFPLDVPGMDIPELPLFRAQTAVDGSYLLYDGGLSEAQKGLEETALNTNLQKVLVDQYPVHAQVNQAFFGLLLSHAQVRILEQGAENLQNRIRTLEAAKAGGVALQIDIDQLEVRRLELLQQIAQLKGKAVEGTQMLETLTGQSFSESTEWTLPQYADFQFDRPVERPELELFQLQKLQITAQEGLIEAARKPKINLFVQAGLGYPNPLNFFDDSLSPFALGGVGFTWTITDWKKSSVDRQLLSVQTQLVDNQQAGFLDQIEKMKSPFRDRLQTLQELVKQGEKIKILQEGILATFSNQLDQGVLTSTDYIEQLNKTTQAQLNVELYQLQMSQLKTEYLTLIGSQ